VPNTAEIKLSSRRRLHRAAAVSAVYTSPDGEAVEDRITVRWHNKLARLGELEGGFDVQIIEGVNRLVFSDEQLAEYGLELEERGRVSIPSLGGAVFSLQDLEPTDGPHNVYWQVVRVV